MWMDSATARISHWRKMARIPVSVPGRLGKPCGAAAARRRAARRVIALPPHLDLAREIFDLRKQTQYAFEKNSSPTPSVPLRFAAPQNRNTNREAAVIVWIKVNTAQSAQITQARSYSFVEVTTFSALNGIQCIDRPSYCRTTLHSQREQPLPVSGGYGDLRPGECDRDPGRFVARAEAKAWPRLRLVIQIWARR